MTLIRPPRVDGSLHEFMAPHDARLGHYVAASMSTRCFLLCMSKLEARFLPVPSTLRPFHKRWVDRWRGRSSNVALESMISSHLAAKHCYRVDLTPQCGFSLHAWNKRSFSSPSIDWIIHRIEQGQVPPNQIGQLNLLMEEFLAEKSGRAKLRFTRRVRESS